MATISKHGSNILLKSGNTVKFYHERSEKCEEYKTVKLPHGGEDKKDAPTDAGTDRILCGTISRSGALFAVCDDYKQLTLWKSDQTQWTRLSIRILSRRCTALVFTAAEDKVLVADKSGDVYSYSTVEPEKPGSLVLGHVSILLDLALCSGDKLIATCDRDEKIRISHYPNSHSIHSFCLGHNEFVSKLLYVEEEDILISGSGDSTLRFWNYKEGKELSCVNCREHLPEGFTAIQTQSTDKEEGSKPEDDPDPSDEEKMDEGEPEETEESRVDVKCLSYCPVEKLLAVGFEGITTMLIYKLGITDPKPCVEVRNTISVDQPPWDLTFDAVGRLWVISPNEEEPLSVFCNEGAEFTLYDKKSDRDNLAITIKSINSDWSFFKASVGVESMYPLLHKPKVDNMPEYLERKQQRIKSEQDKHRRHSQKRNQKRQKLQPTSGDGDANQLKKSKDS